MFNNSKKNMKTETPLNIAFVGYQKRDYLYNQEESVVEKTFQSIQYLLNQVEKKQHFDILFINYDGIEQRDIDFLFNIVKLIAHIKIIIEYNKFIPITLLVQLYNNHIYPLVFNSSQQQINYKFYIQAVQENVLIMPDYLFIDYIKTSNESEHKEWNNFYNLNDFDITMLVHLSKGGSYEEAAKELGMKLNTFRYHIKRLYKKMNVHNKVKATDYYYKNLHNRIMNQAKIA